MIDIYATYDPYHDGYNAEALEIDRQEAESRPCRKCGGQMEFHPLRSPRGGYAALAHCLDCGNEIEI